MQILEWIKLKKKLTARKLDAHKGDFGHVLVIGGAPGFSGAVRLAGESALRVGAGMVSIATHPEHAAYLNVTRPELMCHAIADEKALAPLFERATVILLGPGLGMQPWGQMLWHAALSVKKPIVLDADGLNLLAQNPTQRTDWILTPHPAEAARLMGDVTTQTIQADRQKYAQALQKAYSGVVVLKGADTLIATEKQIFLNPVSNPAMATAGMGDVLSGIIAGLCAQGLSLADAAKLGVVVHSSAAEEMSLLIGERGMLASDLWAVLTDYVNG